MNLCLSNLLQQSSPTWPFWLIGFTVEEAKKCPNNCSGSSVNKSKTRATNTGFNYNKISEDPTLPSRNCPISPIQVFRERRLNAEVRKEWETRQTNPKKKKSSRGGERNRKGEISTTKLSNRTWSRKERETKQKAVITRTYFEGRECVILVSGINGGRAKTAKA